MYYLKEYMFHHLQKLKVAFKPKKQTRLVEKLYFIFFYI